VRQDQKIDNNSCMFSVVVLNWNKAELLIQCLESIHKQRFSNFETIVIDNGSTDDSTEVVREIFPNVRLVAFSRNYGFAEGYNKGLESCRGEWLFLLNNDTQLERDCLRNIDLAIKRLPENVGSLTPRMLLKTTNEIDTLGHRLHISFVCIDIKDESEVHTSIGPCGGAAVYRKRMIDEVCTDGQLFDPRFHLYVEDFDLNLRCYSQGWRNRYIPNAIVWHHKGASSRVMPDQSLYYLHRNMLLTIMRNIPLSRFLCTGHLILMAQLWAIFYHAYRGKGSIVLRAKIDALKHLPLILKERQSQSSRLKTDRNAKRF